MIENQLVLLLESEMSLDPQLVTVFGRLWKLRVKGTPWDKHFSRAEPLTATTQLLVLVHSSCSSISKHVRTLLSQPNALIAVSDPATASPPLWTEFFFKSQVKLNYSSLVLFLLGILVTVTQKYLICPWSYYIIYNLGYISLVVCI